jgi:uncharacterized OsmC-like protein
VTEKVIIRQNHRFETEFQSVDPHTPESEELQPVERIHALTPYGMLLASLGSCTAILLNTYAQNHGLNLREVELRLQYGRVFKKDCENCEEIEKYEGQIEQEIVLKGKLKPEEREKLFVISRYCPIHRMVESGIKVQSQLAPESVSRRGHTGG